MTHWLDLWLRRREETIGRVGALRFPFLRREEQREMFYGLYERPTVDFLRQWLRPGDLFVDVGANVGYLTAVGADCVGPQGKVYAFEPEREHFVRLERLVDLNPAFPIAAVRSAVGEGVGTIDLLISPHAGWHTIIDGFNRGAGGYRKREKVALVSLDHLFAQPGAGEKRSIRCVKVDVEGAESPVLRGAKRLTERGAVEAFLVEVTPPGPEYPCEAIEPLFGWMSHAGYAAYRQVRSAAWELVAPAALETQTMILWKLAR